MRHQTAKRARVAKSLDKRVARLQTVGRRPGRAGRSGATGSRSPCPPHTGRLVLEADGLAKAYGGPPVFEDVSFAVERGERLLIMGLNGAGKTSLLRILAGWSEPSAGTFRTGVGVSVGYYAQEHEGIRAGADGPRPPAGGSRDEPPSRTSGPCSACSGWSARWPSRMPAPCRAGRRPSWPWPSWSPAGTTCCCSTSRPTTSIPPSREAIGRALADWPGAMILVSHDVGFVTELAPDRVLLMPDGTEDHWSDDLLDLVAMA